MMKKLTGCLLFLSMLMVGPVWSVSLNDLQVKELNAAHSAVYVSSNNSLAMKLSYVGDSTECVITVSHIALRAYAPSDTADTSFGGGSTGTYNLSDSGYNTFGKLCDAIHALDDYNCSLLGAKRNDNTTLIRNQTASSGTNDLKDAGGFDVKFDLGTDAAEQRVYIIRVGITPQSGKRVVLKKIIGNSNGTNNIKIWGKLRKYEGVEDGVTRNDTTNIWNEATADDTDKTLMSGDRDILEFAKDEHVVIGEGDGGTDYQQADAVNDIQVFWMEK